MTVILGRDRLFEIGATLPIDTVKAEAMDFNSSGGKGYASI